MVKFITPLIYEDIDSKYVRLTEPFIFESDVLRKNGFDSRVEVPAEFVCDLESVPRIPIIYSLYAGTSKKGGVGHDYLCRIDSIPVVSKKIAAQVYLEIMETRGNPWRRRIVKYYVVRVAWGYYHKLTVGASYEEIVLLQKGRLPNAHN